jgi:hydrogenase maturation protease
MKRTLIMGVGNTLLTDEGAGVHALRHVAEMPELPDDVIFLDAGTLSFTLADAIAAADNLVVLDAAELAARPGHVHAFVGEAMDEFLKSGKRSVHEVGFADLLDIARLQDCLPDNRALIGIQPAEFGWGETPSAMVSEAIPTAAALAVNLVDQWTDEPAALAAGP